jgi:hypothetical protein
VAAFQDDRERVRFAIAGAEQARVLVVWFYRDDRRFGDGGSTRLANARRHFSDPTNGFLVRWRARQALHHSSSANESP